MEIYAKLGAIQQGLKAPKSKDAGRYKYRSCEDILEAVKPLLKETGCALVITDDVVLIGQRFYIKAMATLYSGNESVYATAFAREDEVYKNMSSAQGTGSSSSYARKYALNGLLCIDDNKDPDELTAMTHVQINNADDIQRMCKEWHITEPRFCQFFGIRTLQEMIPDMYGFFNKDPMNVINQLGGKR